MSYVDVAVPADEEPTGLDIAYDDHAGVGVRLEDWATEDGRCRFIGLVFVTRRGERAYDLTPAQATALRDALAAVINTDLRTRAYPSARATALASAQRG